MFKNTFFCFVRPINGTFCLRFWESEIGIVVKKYYKFTTSPFSTRDTWALTVFLNKVRSKFRKSKEPNLRNWKKEVVNSDQNFIILWKGCVGGGKTCRSIWFSLFFLSPVILRKEHFSVLEALLIGRETLVTAGPDILGSIGLTLQLCHISWNDQF